MTNIIPYLISQGMPAETIAYLLLMPLLATVIVALRQLVGLKSLGVYHPLLLSFAFISLGIREGIVAFLAIVILANLATHLVKKFPLLYLPRLTIVVTVTTLASLLVISIIRLSDYQFSLEQYLPLIIILALSDKLVSVQLKRNLKSTLFLAGGTLAIAVMGYYLLRLSQLQEIVLGYPLIFLAIILLVNIALGRFRGLRLNELWRFRSLLKLPDKK